MMALCMREIHFYTPISPSRQQHSQHLRNVAQSLSMSSFNKISVLNGRIEAVVYNENTIIQKKHVLEDKDTAYFSFYGFSFPQFNLTVTLSYKKNINLQKREIRNCVLQRSMIGFPL